MEVHFELPLTLETSDSDVEKQQTAKQTNVVIQSKSRNGCRAPSVNSRIYCYRRNMTLLLFSVT